MAPDPERAQYLDQVIHQLPNRLRELKCPITESQRQVPAF